MAKSKKSPTSSRSAKPKRAKGKTTPLPLDGRVLARSKRAWKDRAVADLAATKAALAPGKLPSMLTDPRLPEVGHLIVRQYKGKEYQVVRQADHFEHAGRRYPSLSAIAREIIGGAQVNGFAFFGLVKKPAAKASS